MAVGTKNLGQMKEELGDILFSIVNVARFLDLEAEEALSETNNKFLRRFSLMEDEAQHQGCDLSALSLEEMDILWEKAKEKRKINKTGKKYRKIPFIGRSLLHSSELANSKLITTHI